MEGDRGLHPQGTDVRDFAKANRSNWTLPGGDRALRDLFYFQSRVG